MKHLLQPNQWTCLPTSFAMAAGISLEEILEIIGHDGSEIVHQNLNEPYCRRTFHPQECIWAVYQKGFSVTPFEPISLLVAAPNYEITIEQKFDLDLIMSGFGAITGIGSSGVRHAIAYEDYVGYDPNGTVIDFENQDFQVETIWKFDLI